MEEPPNTNGSSGQSNYPNPNSNTTGPYPTAQWSAYGSFPGSVSYPSPYGPFPGSLTNGPISDPQRHISPVDHHITDFRSFLGPGQANGGVTPTPYILPQQPITEVQRLAQSFHMRHGDPGSGSAASSAQLEQNPQWMVDEYGGRVGAREAYQAARDRRSRLNDFNDHEGGVLDEVLGGADLLGIDYGSGQGTQESPRGTKRGRPRGSGQGRGRGRGGWRKLLKGTEHEAVGTNSTQSRGTRGGSTRRRGRPRKIADPGPEFKKLMTKATQAKLDGDIDTAADFARLAVQSNPEVYQAHSLLSELLKQQGKGEESAQTLWVGAQAARTVEAWTLTADRILELIGNGPTTFRLRAAIDCYSEALRLDSILKYDKDLEYEIRAKKFELYLELNDSKGARMDCKNILKQWPRKTYYLREYARLCSAWGDESELVKAKEAYDHAFDLYQDEEHFGDEHDPEGSLQWSHLNIYLEVVQDLPNPWDGIAKAKQVARRFLGRKQETFWDRYKDDDREFDESNERRIQVPEFQWGKASQDMYRYGQGLPVDIRVRLGLLRVKCGSHCYEEALNHFRALLPYGDRVHDYFDMFQQVAACLRKAGLMIQAKDYFDCLRRIGDDDDDQDELLDDNSWIQVATFYQALDQTEDAIACWELVRIRKGDGYVKACAKLAKIYEDGGEIDKARSMCNELIMLNRRDQLTDAGVKMVPPSTRTAPVFTPLRSSLSRPLPQFLPPKPTVPLRELRPSGMPNDMTGMHANFQFGGPISAPVELPPARPDLEEPDEDEIEYEYEAPAPKKRKRGGGRKKKESIIGDDEDPDIDDRPVKKSRAKKKKKSVVGSITGAEEPDADDRPVKRPRLKKPPKARKPEGPRLPNKQELAYQQRLASIQDAETRALSHYAIVRAHWNAFKDGKDEEAVEQWVEAANGLLEEFSGMKVFFPSRDRNFTLKATTNPARPFLKSTNKTGLAAPESFLALRLADWHRIFVDLALHYAKSGEQDRCNRVLKDVLFAAVVFNKDEELQWISYAAGIYCGLTFNDSEYLITLVRQILSNNEFRGPMAYQLLAAVNRFAYGNNWFNAGPTQKFMLRMVKQVDYIAMPAEYRQLHDWSTQTASLAERVKKYAEEDKELDAGLLLMYGHMVAVSNHANSALPYYYRALAIQPENICVNLSIAVMWVQNSMKRQVSNRQYGIAQGLTFLYRYYDLRVASGKACHLQEAEYNVARLWHQLGLIHLALPAYEKVLGLSEAVRMEKMYEEGMVEFVGEDFAMEAAYALQNMYALAGNYEAATRVTEEFLVL